MANIFICLIVNINSFKSMLISPCVNTRYSTYMYINGQGLNIWVHGHGPLTYYPQLTEFTSRLYFQPFRNIYIALNISNIIWWLSSDHRCVQLLLLLKELILFLWWIKEMSNRQKIHPAPHMPLANVYWLAFINPPTIVIHTHDHAQFDRKTQKVNFNLSE